MSGYRIDATGNLVPMDPYAAWNTPVSTMDQVSQLSSGGNWLAQPNGASVPGMPSGVPAGFGMPATTGVLSRLGKLGGWLGKNGQTIGNWANVASQGINAYVGLQQLGLAKDAFKSGKTIRELCEEKKLLAPETLKQALDPWRMTEPQAD